MGTWTYTYNSAGELLSQTDAKSQTATLAYDALGRLTSRTEGGQSSAWTYDGAWKGVGKLQAATAPGYARYPEYDGYGVSVRGTSPCERGEF